jgi:hypothetical protein
MAVERLDRRIDIEASLCVPVVPGAAGSRSTPADRSSPLFLSAVATRTRHARQTTIRVTSSHARAKPAARALAAVALFLRSLAQNAEQLTRLETWRAILSRAFRAFLKNRPIRPQRPHRPAAARPSGPTAAPRAFQIRAKPPRPPQA